MERDVRISPSLPRNRLDIACKFLVISPDDGEILEGSRILEIPTIVALKDTSSKTRTTILR